MQQRINVYVLPDLQQDTMLILANVLQDKLIRMALAEHAPPQRLIGMALPAYVLPEHQ